MNQKKTNVGLVGGHLPDCTGWPNCVCTRSTKPQNAIPPIPWTGPATEAMARLKTILESEPRTRIVAQTDNYLHAEFTSAVIGFVDDVEFHVDSDDQKIHFRSASRLGLSDFGVNRQRMERLRAKFERK